MTKSQYSNHEGSVKDIYRANVRRKQSSELATEIITVQDLEHDLTDQQVLIQKYLNSDSLSYPCQLVETHYHFGK